MTETFTKTASSSLNEAFENSSLDELSACEQDFYNNIRPALDSISKNPSEEVVNRIMKFSREN